MGIEPGFEHCVRLATEEEFSHMITDFGDIYGLDGWMDFIPPDMNLIEKYELRKGLLYILLDPNINDEQRKKAWIAIEQILAQAEN